jgi:hypothetical protein
MNPLSGLLGAASGSNGMNAQLGDQLTDIIKNVMPKLLEGGAEILKTLMPQLAPIIDIMQKAIEGLGATAEEFAQASKVLEDPETVNQMNEALT